MIRFFTTVSWIVVYVVQCEENYSPSFCINGGTCLNGAKNVTCLCQTGFTGSYCESEDDDCALEPCHNGGSCYDVGSSYFCICPENYHGQSGSKELFITLAVLFSSLLCGLGAAMTYIAHLRGWKMFNSSSENKAFRSNYATEHIDEQVGNDQEKTEPVMDTTDANLSVAAVGTTNPAYEELVINQMQEGLNTYSLGA